MQRHFHSIVSWSLIILLTTELFPSMIFAATALQYTVDASRSIGTISPYIYGKNSGAGNAENLAARRSGGNRLTGYNWENNASNAGSDWNHSSDSYLSDSTIPGKVFTDFHDNNQADGMPYSLVTLQMAGYVARDKNGSVSQSETAPSNRWDRVVPAKGSAFTTTPNLTDGVVYMDELVNFLVQRYGNATSTRGIKGYSLDNEPGLWPSTHPRIHANKPTVAEMIDKSSALAKAVKAVDATAEIFGAVTYGFMENYNLQDAPDWANYKNTYPTYIDAFLAGLKTASDQSGKRLLDVLDVHWYPEAQGTNSGGGKTRIIDNNTDAGVAEARMQAPRSLWDPIYTEDSWIGQWFASSAFPLIPKLKNSIDRYYPGTKLSFSEFDYGANGHISGGIATADVLGIFGKYGVYFATYWGNVDGYVSSAYRLYRNYDGAKGTYGDIALETTNPDIVGTSLYASKESTNGRVHLILINKKSTPLPVRVSLAGVSASSAEVYGFDSTSTNIRKYASATIANNVMEYTLPATSAMHFVVTNQTGGNTTNTGTTNTGTTNPTQTGNTNTGTTTPPTQTGVTNTGTTSTGTTNTGVISNGNTGNNSNGNSSPSTPTITGPGGGSGPTGTPRTQTQTQTPPPATYTPPQVFIPYQPFSDIDTSFAREDINTLAARGVISGYSDGTFRPNNTITRAEFLKITLGTYDMNIDTQYTFPYRDVSLQWQKPYISTALRMGVINYASTFRPNDPISRAEAIKIALRAAGLKGFADESIYGDLSGEYAWSVPYVMEAAGLHIIDSNIPYFRPSDPITRAETVKIVLGTRAFKRDM